MPSNKQQNYTLYSAFPYRSTSSQFSWISDLVSSYSKFPSTSPFGHVLLSGLNMKINDFIRQ